jgi:HlyD family secretion protein
MDPGALERLIRSLRTAEPSAGGLTDAQLLERFVAGRDEAAFELLLWRHGPMVLGVCRRLLRRAADAEDAFQATWLTFVRKAHAIADRAAVGSWLYSVAYRIALRARSALARRAARERADPARLAAAPAGAPPSPGEIGSVLDEEINSLPARQRAAFVLCCLEGKTGEDAARHLGCPPGTVSSRLTRARQRLRTRLARRGLAPAAALTAALAGQASASPLPAPLVDTTLKASLLFAAGKSGADLSPQAVSLAQGALRAMFLAKLKLPALLFLLAGLLAAGAITRHALEAAAPPRAEGLAGPAVQRPDEKREEAPPVVVRAVKPQRGGLERTSRDVGNLRAAEREDVFALVPGVLKGLSVDIGDRVKKGQVLAEIDAPLLALEERAATAAVRQARGQVREAEARIAGAKAAVEAARGGVAQRQAEVKGARSAVPFRERRRAEIKRLVETGAVGREELATADERLDAAKAQVTAAEAALAKGKADLAVEEGKVAQAEAGVETAKANLESARVAWEKASYTHGLTKVVCPFDGVVTQRNYRNGHHLRPADAGRNLPLLTVQRTDRLRLAVDVSRWDAPLVEPGAPVELTFDAPPGVRLTGLKVARIGFALDPVKQSMRVEIDVPNPRERLRPGMSAYTTIHLGKAPAGALRVPLSAVLEQGNPWSRSHAVYVVRGGKAYRTPVQIGRMESRQVEVLSGLKPDDLIVTDGNKLEGKVVPVKVEKGRSPR